MQRPFGSSFESSEGGDDSSPRDVVEVPHNYERLAMIQVEKVSRLQLAQVRVKAEALVTICGVCIL